MLEQIYIGIDIDDEHAIVSRYTPGLPEPQTISVVPGSEVFLIPVVVARNPGEDRWYAGRAAKTIGESRPGLAVDKLLGRAGRHEKVYVDGVVHPARELVAIFLEKLITLALVDKNKNNIARISLTLPSLTREMTEMLFDAAESIGFGRDKIMLIDRKESFYYYAYSQNENLCLYDIFLFDCKGENLSCFMLERDRHTRPQVITASEEIRRLDQENKDETFLGVLQQEFAGRIISSVYLTGEGFEGDWMKRSVSYMCQGRRVFLGRNLYSKGACYGAALRSGDSPWPYVYMGENVMKVNIFLKVSNRGHMDFAPLIGAGENWYEAGGECDVILDGDNEINFWIQPPHSTKARIEQVTLADLPERQKRTTRLHIEARAISDKAVRINIKDLGFGEYFKSSGKTFEHTIRL